MKNPHLQQATQAATDPDTTDTTTTTATATAPTATATTATDPGSIFDDLASLRKASNVSAQPVLDPHSLIAGLPVIDTPALGQVHNLGPPPHDLIAVNLAVSPPDIAPQFKPPTPPAAKEATPQAKKKRKQRVGRQGDILDGLLQQLQRVNNNPTSEIHRMILKRWPTDSRTKFPSYETVARHLGRRKD
jgi:hypothetical protein